MLFSVHGSQIASVAIGSGIFPKIKAPTDRESIVFFNLKHITVLRRSILLFVLCRASHYCRRVFASNTYPLRREGFQLAQGGRGYLSSISIHLLQLLESNVDLGISFFFLGFSAVNTYVVFVS